VILAVAAAEDSAFERSAHEALGRGAGLSDQDLLAVEHGGDLPGQDQVEHAALAATRALVAQGDLDDDAYASAVSVLGERALFEIMTLVGYYRTIALQLRVFRIGAPQSG
jgi:4-carboxymuconolactone decarboxylase